MRISLRISSFGTEQRISEEDPELPSLKRDKVRSDESRERYRVWYHIYPVIQ